MARPIDKLPAHLNLTHRAFCLDDGSGYVGKYGPLDEYYASVPGPLPGLRNTGREALFETNSLDEAVLWLKAWRLLNGMNEDGTPT